MEKLICALIFSLCLNALNAQNLYFPPLTGNTWETLSPDSLGYCPDRIQNLYDLLETNNTKAFLLLKDGRIVLEKYFGTFTQDSIWYWASAGKSMTAALVGIAQQEGLLSIEGKTSDHLGTGWTACPPEKEDLITVRHQLTMTTGLDDGVPENYCTLDTCLIFKADAGTRWAYHNGPYTLLDGVIEAASGQNFNQFFNQRMAQKTGITGLWVKVDYNNVLFSKARSMARYGLLMLNNGTWNNTPVLTDPAYFQAMTTPSQDLNKSYGYLWWLNGQPSYRLPGLQINIPGPLFPAAPDDVYAALGKNGQFINVSPSTGLVMVRMGDEPGTDAEVPALFNDDIWVKINELVCEPSAVIDQKQALASLQIYPNPAHDFAQLGGVNTTLPFQVEVYDVLGRRVLACEDCSELAVDKLVRGMFQVVARQDGKVFSDRLLVE
ncbi:MAG: serine hydrolase [Saprospiraceae bacterium]|nr:serine hydrolase [Saprospiraceae bacterium]